MQGAVVKVLGVPTGQTTSHAKFLSSTEGYLGVKLVEPVRAARRRRRHQPPPPPAARWIDACERESRTA